MTLKRHNVSLAEQMVDNCYVVLQNFLSLSTGTCGFSGGSKVAQHLQRILCARRARVESRGNLAGHEPAV